MVLSPKASVLWVGQLGEVAVCLVKAFGKVGKTDVQCKFGKGLKSMVSFRKTSVMWVRQKAELAGGLAKTFGNG